MTIKFDDELFSAIAAKSQKEDVTFAEQVRRFCEWGLMDIK